MLRLSSKDSALIMDVVEQPELTEAERKAILSESNQSFLPELGEILVNPGYVSENKELVDLAADIKAWMAEVAATERF